MKNFLLILFSMMSVACASVRQAAPSEKIQIETRTETVYETDTVFIEIPKIIEAVQTMDTTSVLENEFAKTTAEYSGGCLSHSLETKQVRKPVEIQKEIIYKDSIVFRDRVIKDIIEVEKELTRWQSFKIKTGELTLGLLIIAIVCMILYFVKHLNF